MNQPNLHPLTLAFEDQALEKKYLADSVQRSLMQVRGVIVLMIALSLLLEPLFNSLGAYAIQQGINLLGDAPPPKWLIVASLAAFIALFAATFSAFGQRYLQEITIVTLLVTTFQDVWQSQQLAMPLVVSTALGHVIIVFFAFRLRFAYAAVLAWAVIFGHLIVLAVTRDLTLPINSLLLMLSAVWLTVVGIITTFTAYQGEVSARRTYHQAELVAQQRAQLASALADLKAAEAQLVETEKQALVGRLVAGVLHELNTPLGALGSSLDVLQRALSNLRELVSVASGAPPEAAAKAYRSLEAGERVVELHRVSGRRIADTVQQLRRFAGLDQPSRAVFDLKESLSVTLALLAPEIGEGIVVEQQFCEQNLRVEGDAGRLNRALLSVLENAVRALKGAGCLKVEANAMKDKVMLRVQDDGPGIPEGERESLFEPRLTRHGSRVKLSLGLPTAKRTVEEMGGELVVESDGATGTTVTITLPLLAEPDATLLAAAQERTGS